MKDDLQCNTEKFVPVDTECEYVDDGADNETEELEGMQVDDMLNLLDQEVNNVSSNGIDLQFRMYLIWTQFKIKESTNLGTKH